MNLGLDASRVKDGSCLFQLVSFGLVEGAKNKTERRAILALLVAAGQRQE